MNAVEPGIVNEASIRAIERPHQNLLVLYFLQALATLVAFPFVFLPLLFRYRTLRYRFDDEGISASWGILFRREIHLTYRRIQDIHVHRNVIERWLGIGRVEIQTASGSAAAELALEGMDRYDEVRDFLYGRMRGVQEKSVGGASPEGPSPDEPDAEAVALLRAIRDEVEGARRALEKGG